MSFTDWLTKDESGSTTIRNLGLVIGAVLALGLTMRRLWIAGREAKTAQQELFGRRQLLWPAPNLTGVVDEDGKSLEWRGKDCGKRHEPVRLPV